MTAALLLGLTGRQLLLLAIAAAVTGLGLALWHYQRTEEAE
jgi:hypothetical protein